VIFSNPKLQAVQALEPYELHTVWSTGEELVIDLEPVLLSIPALANLLSPKIFRKAHLDQVGSWYRVAGF